jgi:alpha,alpha-trehalase
VTATGEIGFLGKKLETDRRSRMRLGPEKDRVTMSPNPRYTPRSRFKFKPPTQAREIPKDPLDLRVGAAGAQSLESRSGVSPSAPKTVEQTTPSILNQTEMKASLPPLSPLMAPETRHYESFLSLFKNDEKQAWSEVLTYTREYSPDKIDVPFPYPGDHNGRLEQNDLDVVIRGLWAKGGHDQARGVLENWLHLGERYTALPGTNQLNDLGRAGMPRLSTLLLEEADRHQDPHFLERSYQVISNDHQHNWSDGYFKQSKNGLNRFCDVDYSHDATMDESGGSKNQARFDGDPMPFNPIDLNSFLYRTEKDLAEMAKRLADSSGDTSWSEKARTWDEKAAQRKAVILEKMWCPERGLFADIETADGSPSSVNTLATLAVLEAGVLDPRNPKELGMAQKLVASTRQFLQPDGKAVWDTKANTPAEARDLLGYARGLENFGFRLEAGKMRKAAELAIGEENNLGNLASRAILTAETAAKEGSGSHTKLEAWVSPQGLARLRTLSNGLGVTEAPEVPVSKASALDRQLGRLHESLLSLPVVRELQQRNLAETVMGVAIKRGTAQTATPLSLKYLPSEHSSVQLGDTRLNIDLPNFEQAPMGDGAVRIRSKGQELNLVITDHQLILGDRAYPLEEFTNSKEIRLPRDILGAFHTGGGNPQLEEFFHANRDWVKIETGPQSRFEGIPGRPGWAKLYQDIGKNWKELTIEPSVTDHDTAMQYFNPAAVPSLGIFKTQFNWDTMFMAKGMQLQGQEETVAGMADNLLYLLKSTGRVPNAARSVYLNKSQPPFLPSLVRMSEPIRTRTIGAEATQKWVKEAYDVMAGDFRNFWREDGARNVGQIEGKKVRLSRWGGPNHKFAMDESGFDTTSRFYGKTMDLVPPDLNAFLWGYSRDMEAIALRLRDQAQLAGNKADFLKYSSEGAVWGEEAKRIKQDVIEHCWDAEDGMFRDYRFQGESQGLEKEQDALSACVAPLWVGMLDPKVPAEKEMIERSLDNISRFEKDHGLASTAEDYGHPEMQWNGPSGWAPLHMMAIESEVRYGRYDAAARQTQKWLDTIDGLYQKDGVIIERYDVVKGGYPPVQKGRYEETQGEGPGFGWTNATVPWALIEVVGGVRLHRDAAAPTRMDVIPHLPEGTQSGPIRMTFTNPGSSHEWKLSHHHQRDKESYQFSIDGDFSAVPNLTLLTPPLPRGQRPRKSDNCPPYTIKEKPAEGGLVRYEVTFTELHGRQKLDLSWSPETGAF